MGIVHRLARALVDPHGGIRYEWSAMLEYPKREQGGVHGTRPLWGGFESEC